MTNEQFDTVFRREYPRLYRLAYAMLRDGEECRDIVSQVMADLYERPPRQCDDAGKLAAYLSQAVRNRCLDYIDHLQVTERVQQLYPLEQQIQSQRDTDRESLLRDVWQYINTELTQQTRQVLMLRYDEELSYEEVADRLQVSVSAVNKHISQGLAKLRSHFTNWTKK